MLKNKKILPLVVILLIIVIAGIALIFFKGMNYDLFYGQNTTIKMYIDAKTEKSDIKNIATEIFGKQNSITEVNDLANNIVITVKSASSEQINTLIQKINEKYSLEIKTEDIEVVNNPQINGLDLIYPYILPASITSILILIYFMIRYRKIGMLKVLEYTLFTVIGIQILYLSIYSCARLPIGMLTMPISMVLFILSIIILTEVFENKINIIKTTQKKK